LNTRTAQARSALIVHISDFNVVATERIHQITQQFLDNGMSLDEASNQAIMILGRSLNKQQAILAYCQGFFVMGISVLCCLVIISLIRRNQTVPSSSKK
jgi:DHA2 family multidrug resistance protein